MVELTFLEVHVQDASFTKGGGQDADGDVAFEAAAEDHPPESGSSKGAVMAALVGLVFLAVVAYLVKTRFPAEEDEVGYEFDSYD